MARLITIDEELEELQRELIARQREYPTLTIGPKPALKREEAARRLARLESAINRLLKLQRTQPPPAQGLLFTEEF